MTKAIKGGAAIGPAPLEQAYTQVNGRQVIFRMPHPMKFANGQVDVPNDALASIYRLLFDPFETVAPEKQYIYDQRYHRSLLYIYQLVCTPRVNLDDETPDQEGEISALEIAWPDLMAGFHFFRYGPSQPVSITGTEDDSAGARVVLPDATVSE